MKKSAVEKADALKKLRRTKLTAFMRIMQRIPTATNNTPLAASSLYPLEVSADDGSLPPPGVCKSARDAAATVVTVELPSNVRVRGKTISAAMNHVLATRYSNFIRCSTEKLPVDLAFQDFQNELYCRVTEIAFSTFAKIALEIVHDGYAASILFQELVEPGTNPLEVAVECLLTKRNRPSAQFKGTACPIEQARLTGTGDHITDIVSGVEPMIVWPERCTLGQERISVTNHGQKLLNKGMTFYMEQQWSPLLWSGFPHQCEDGTLYRDDCHDDDEEPVLSDRMHATHLAHEDRNCIDLNEQATQRTHFLKFCIELDCDSEAQYAPSGEWSATFVCQRPSGHGQAWLNTKLAGMLFMLTHTHATGGGVTLAEIQWHIVRTGASSDTGDFPKATDKPIKFLFVQLLYAVVSHFDPDKSHVAAALCWSEFKEWCRKANNNRQKIQLHHKVFYMWRQLLCRGDAYLTLRINVASSRPIVAPQQPYIVEDWSSKVTNADIVAVFASKPDNLVGCTKLRERCLLHLSLHVICGNQYVLDIIGSMIYARMRSAVRAACHFATHPATPVCTVFDIANAAVDDLGLPLCAPVWSLCDTHVREACGSAILPGFLTHPLYEVLFHELTRLVTPTATLTDIIKVWPAATEQSAYKAYCVSPTVVILSAEPITRAGMPLPIPNCLVGIQTASCAPDVHGCVALSVPEGSVSLPGAVSLDENYILQVFCNTDNHAGCVALSALVAKRSECTLSAQHDVLCNPFVHTPPKPEVSTSTKAPLLISTVCAGGITSWAVKAFPICEWQFTIILFAPTVKKGVSETYIFFLVFDCSDKIMKILSAPPVSTDALLSTLDPSASLEVRRFQLREYALNVCFRDAESWVPIRSTKTVDHAKALPASTSAPSQWDKGRECDSKHYYGAFVEGETNVIGLLVMLLNPLRVEPDALYEGVLQWGACFRAVLNIALDRGDESLWSFISKKERLLRAISSKYAVATSGLLRLQQAHTQLTAQRLQKCDAIEDLCFYGDTTDSFEFMQSRRQSMELKRKADSTDAMMALLNEPALTEPRLDS